MRRPSAEQADAGGRIDPTTGALGEIDVTSFPLVSWTQRHRVLRWPLIRGVVALAESLKIGFKALGISANAQLARRRGADRRRRLGGHDRAVGGARRGPLLRGPGGLTSLIKDQLSSSVLFWLVEGVVRTTIFLGYLVLLSRLRELRRVFEYHGAEHKTIAAYEAGDASCPERVALYSRLHPRCGTSFLLIVMIVAIFVFAPLGLPAWYWLVLSRILGVPLIAGISFEIIKWAGRNRRKRWVRSIMWPGLQLQKLTTREPDAHELAVAIAALDAVLEVERPGEMDPAELVGVEVVA